MYNLMFEHFNLLENFCMFKLNLTQLEVLTLHSMNKAYKSNKNNIYFFVLV